MKGFWKWVERIAWFAAIVSGLKVIGMDNVIIYTKEFWSQLTPWQFLLILSLAVLLCNFIIFLVTLYRRTNSIIQDFNSLKKWIGLFSYRDKYSDLKGKIKLYIKEEIEKEKESQPENSAD